MTKPASLTSGVGVLMQRMLAENNKPVRFASVLADTGRAHYVSAMNWQLC